jgi:hypothetical protein
MLLILLVGVVFYRLAKTRGLMTYLWAFLGVVAGFVGLFAGAGIAMLIDAYSENKNGSALAFILTPIAFMLGMYFYMEHYARKNKVGFKSRRDDLIDRD